ncbi:hypothetical protein BEWA_004010 [Theileria equi strain WA]|uniref:Uncharacterized protein n=1 Tax=Theileria equi strain WA TaxID=1537102 RepID=L0B0H6_THEEQ|nr:hypothetical protein BEWA_004010 [Theileria equi strain WA]AFZ80993.1 hypothetical protein BEWA_004010 [Theileria equi strain WA]|eukprot:XP_004830659.1 hypothetical protein BEWA_004010 [Theileria equi strain WA]
MSKVLTLNVKCGGNPCNCSNSSDIIVSKDETIDNVTSFIAYSHSIKKGESFTLSQNLDGGESLDSGDIQDVEKVAVYYWDRDSQHKTPLLLNITQKDNPKSLYYLRYEDGEPEGNPNPKVWKQYNGVGTSLQDLLDDRNLGRNNVFPLDLNEPTKRLDTGTDVAKKAEVQLVQTSPLTDSDYKITMYKLNGKDGETKFSRAMYDKGKANGIVIPDDILTSIKLYSSSVSSIPIMVEFVKSGKAGSEWFYNTNSQGTNWQGDGGNTFYGSDRQLTESFTKRLDELTCEHHGGVTIDLSHKTSIAQQRYCCNEHGGKKGEGGKVSVKEQKVSCQRPDHSTSSLTVYKHSIKEVDLKLGGIKFYLNNDSSKQNRKHVRSRNLKLPIEGQVDVCVFYCAGNNPVLIYVYANRSTKSQGSSGWYRKSKRGYESNWSKISNMPQYITPDTINNCNSWNKLVGIFNQLKCESFQRCPPEPLPERSDAGEVRTHNQDDDIKLEESEPEVDSYKVRGDAGPIEPLGPLGKGAGKDKTEAKHVTSAKDSEDKEAKVVSEIVKKESEPGPEGAGKGPQGESFQFKIPGALFTVVDEAAKLLYGILSPQRKASRDPGAARPDTGELIGPAGTQGRDDPSGDSAGGPGSVPTSPPSGQTRTQVQEADVPQSGVRGGPAGPPAESSPTASTPVTTQTAQAQEGPSGTSQIFPWKETVFGTLATVVSGLVGFAGLKFYKSQRGLSIGRNIDPEVIEGISLVEVILNSDCSHATLYVSIAGDPFQQRQGLSWLTKRTKRLRYLMAQLLNHRKNVPTISFKKHDLLEQSSKF